MSINNNQKVILNWGLAFDEERVLKKLSDLAKNGWLLREMTLFKYKLEKSEPAELIYSMDYKELNENEEEYFELFDNSGWEHMCSYGPYHFFAAVPGAVPIYTDKENYLEKYKISRKTYFNAMMISLLALVITNLLDFYVVDSLNNHLLDITILIIGLISVAILVPSIMVTVAYFLRFKGIKICNK